MQIVALSEGPLENEESLMTRESSRSREKVEPRSSSDQSRTVITADRRGDGQTHPTNHQYPWPLAGGRVGGGVRCKECRGKLMNDNESWSQGDVGGHCVAVGDRCTMLHLWEHSKILHISSPN